MFANMKKLIDNGSVVCFSEYKGDYVTYDGRIINTDKLKEVIKEHIDEGFEFERYLYGVYKIKNFVEICLEDEIINQCHDGYEDMEYNFDFNDSNLKMAQEYLDKFFKEHESANSFLEEDNSLLVDVQCLIDEIKNSK